MDKVLIAILVLLGVASMSLYNLNSATPGKTEVNQFTDLTQAGLSSAFQIR